MKKAILAAVMIMLCVPAFAAAKKKKKKKVKANSAIQSVTINRTGCYGRCPTYSIKIEPNGMVTYNGTSNVADSGIYTKNIGAAGTTAIINKLIGYRADTCKNLYENQIPDLPGLIYTIQYRDSTKRINNAHWGPKYLKETAVYIDDLGKVHDKTWKKGK